MLHPDDNGIWGSCDQCGFSGDSLDILMQKFNTPSVEAVLHRLEQKGAMPQASMEAVTDYQVYKIRQETWARFIKDARDEMLQHGCDLRTLQAIGAPPPFKKEWKEGFGQYVGAASQEKLGELLGVQIKRSVDKVLILPFYDMPGRLANIRIVSCNARGLVTLDKATSHSGGLFMLGSVFPNSEYVIAVDDPVLACRLQLKRMVTSLSPLPIVAYRPDTRYWPIAPKRIVFWAPKPTAVAFNQARKVPGSYLCIPSTTWDFDAALREKTIDFWVHRVMTNARPWASALKETLLSMEEVEAIRFARDLDITPLETGEILFDCAHEEKTRLSSILDLRASVRNCALGDQQVIERDGGWWTYTEKGRSVRVTNAPFALEHSVHYVDKGSYLVGRVTMDGRAERFMAPVEEFMNSPGKWLRKFAMRKGLGLVQLLGGWDRRLMDISRSFNPEKMPHLESKAIVGWSDDLDKFHFPGVTLTRGRVDECELGLPDDNMPCTKVTGHPTQRSAWAAFAEDNHVNRVFLALLACVTANLGARKFGYSPKKIGVIGPHRNLTLFTSIVDLCTVQLSSMANATAKVQPFIQHDVPVCLIPTGNFKSFVDWLETSGIKNVLVGLNHAQAALLGGNDWVFVNAQDMSGAIGHLHAGTNLLADMVRMVQGRTMPIPSDDRELDLLQKAHDWCEQNKCQCPSDVFSAAGRLITQTSMYGSLTTCEAFLFSLFAMIMEDQVSVSRAGFSKKSGEVEMSDQSVKLAKTILQRMILPIGTSALTSELESAGYLDKTGFSEWYVNRVKWDEQYERWVALKES